MESQVLLSARFPLPEPWLRVHYLYRSPVEELLAEVTRRLRPLPKVHEVALEEALITRIAQLPFVDTKNTALSNKLFKYLRNLATASVSASVRDAKSGLRHRDYDLGGSHGLSLLVDFSALQFSRYFNHNLIRLNS